MERRIDRSCLPRNVLQAIDTIYEYLPSSLLTEIRISKQDGSFCTPTSGISPSPPPEDVRAKRSIPRKFAYPEAFKRTSVKTIKTRRQHIPRSLDDIRKALEAAMRIAVLPETIQEKDQTFQTLYQIAFKARKNEAILAWHRLGMKLHSIEDSEISESNVGKLFHEQVPDVSTKSLENALSKARRIYDITSNLSSSQILSLTNVIAADIKSVTKKNLYKLNI